MSRVSITTIAEVEELLSVVASWSEEEVEALPRLYRERAKMYRALANQGE